MSRTWPERYTPTRHTRRLSSNSNWRLRERSPAPPVKSFVDYPRSSVRRFMKKDADYVFYELTRSICPKCRKVIDAKILLRDNKVYMRKRCPDCGPFEALVYADAEAYTSFGKYNKPGTIPLAYGSAIRQACPHDLRLCPHHQQPTCLGLIHVNCAC